jgi:methylated-DNA-[protein]-cysteine S-methyltransferase
VAPLASIRRHGTLALLRLCVFRKQTEKNISHTRDLEAQMIPEHISTRFTTMPSPIGELLVTADDEGVTGVFMEVHRHGPGSTEGWVRDDDMLANVRRQLDEYFAGKRRDFDLVLNPHGTDFQQRVWKELREIPYAGTCSYGDIANAIGNPKGVRAVGLANGRNPISIIVPCHRVIGSNGSLTGYGGGIERKEWLLAHEQRHGGQSTLFA